MGFCGTDRFSYDQNLPANHANSRESKRGTLSNAILISAVAGHRSFSSILALICVIRGLNVFGCGGAALDNSRFHADRLTESLYG
jgi:hypothetical protein